MHPETANIPEIVDVGYATYIMIRGYGPWDDRQGAYAKACSVLRKIRTELEKSAPDFDPALKRSPLETFWWQREKTTLDLDNKETLVWVVAIQVGNISPRSFQTAKESVSSNPSIDCSNAFLGTISERRCVQIRHTGGYENEKETVAIMMAFASEEGYEANHCCFSPHHEIYLPSKEKGKRGQWDTIFRRSIRKQTSGR